MFFTNFSPGLIGFAIVRIRVPMLATAWTNGHAVYTCDNHNPGGSLSWNSRCINHARGKFFDNCGKFCADPFAVVSQVWLTSLRWSVVAAVDSVAFRSSEGFCSAQITVRSCPRVWHLFVDCAVKKTCFGSQFFPEYILFFIARFSFMLIFISVS